MQTASLKGYRLSQQQERMWSLQKAGRGGYAQALVEVEGALDLAGLQQALHQIVERHSILRTVFYTVPGMDTPVQIIKPRLELSFHVLNLEILPPTSQQLEVQGFIAKQIREPFDLAD